MGQGSSSRLNADLELETGELVLNSTDRSGNPNSFAFDDK